MEYNMRTTNDAVNAMQTDFEEGKQTVTYVCGSCGKNNKLDQGSVIKCSFCGHRILYKKRERKLLQYEAR